MTSWLWTFRAFEQALNQKNHPLMDILLSKFGSTPEWENCFRSESWSCAVCHSLNEQNIIIQTKITSWLWTFRAFEQALNQKIWHPFDGQNLDQHQNEKML